MIGNGPHRAPHAAYAIALRQRRLAPLVLTLAVALLPVVAAADGLYVVQAGDTLSAIASANGTTVDDLVLLNGLLDPDYITVGQRLRLAPDDTVVATPTVVAEEADTDPGACQAMHVVVSGDTLSGIAQRYGVTVAEIAAANQIVNTSMISVGQRLQIPREMCQQPVDLVAPFTAATWEPELPVQGDTVKLTVRVDGEIGTLAGSFGGAPFSFLGSGDTYTAYIGVPALAEPGYRQVQLTIDGVPVQMLAIPVAAGDFATERLVFDEETTKLLDPAIVQNENNILARATAPFTSEVLWDGPFAMPLAGDPAVTSAFGTRRAYNDGEVTSYHGGTDFDVEEGTEVMAAAAGVVVLAERLDVRGNAVIVDHGVGVYTMYCHLSRIDAAVGDSVEPGDVVGLVGSTGLSTGPHLHWEMRVQGERVDAMRWLSR